MYKYLIILYLIISSGYGKSMTNKVVLEYQDSIGQYSFGYSAPESARSEIRSADGFTRGAFSYVDDTGVIQTAKYTADSVNGFRIQASNLPESPNPVEDTPEVKAARLDHLRAHEEALKNIEINNYLETIIKQKDIHSDVTVPKIISSDGKKTDDVELNKRAEMKEKIPATKSSLITPKSNVNSQNRIKQGAMDLLTSGAPFQSMFQAEAVETPVNMMVKSEMMNEKEDSSTVILRTVQRLPTAYAQPDYLHFVPSYYF